LPIHIPSRRAPRFFHTGRERIARNVVVSCKISSRRGVLGLLQPPDTGGHHRTQDSSSNHGLTGKNPSQTDRITRMQRRSNHPDDATAPIHTLIVFIASMPRRSTMRYSKVPAIAVLAFTISLSFLAVPVYAANSSAHTLTLNLVNVGYSCSSPTTVSGTVTGKDPLRRDVKLTITNSADPGVIYASASAEVKHGAYTATLSITSSTLQEGFLTVTAYWHGVVVSVGEDGLWAC